MGSLTVTSDVQMHAYDLGDSQLGSAPNGWTNPNFDDSSWSYAQPVSSDVFACMQKNSFTGSTAWYGSQQADNYLFRRSFTLPNGPYGAAVLNIGGLYEVIVGASLWMNGQDVHDYGGQDTLNPRIDPYLHSGKNVIGLYWNTTLAMGIHCTGFNFSVTITFPSTAPLVPAGPRLHTLLPTANLTWPSKNTLPFSWLPYAKATRYLLQIWLTKGAASATAPIGLSETLTGTGYQLAPGTLPPGTYQWRMIAYGPTGPVSAWTPEMAFTLLP
jgi:hypothetical protein